MVFQRVTLLLLTCATLIIFGFRVHWSDCATHIGAFANKMLSYLHVRRLLPLQPLQRHHTDDAADTREPITAFSGTSRTSRVASVLFQRHTPALPPDTDAGKGQRVA